MTRNGLGDFFLRRGGGGRMTCKIRALAYEHVDSRSGVVVCVSLAFLSGYSKTDKYRCVRSLPPLKSKYHKRNPNFVFSGHGGWACRFFFVDHPVWACLRVYTLMTSMSKNGNGCVRILV